MSQERTPHEVKDMGIKKRKDDYERNTGKTADAKKLKEFDDLYVKEILPKVFKQQ